MITDSRRGAGPSCTSATKDNVTRVEWLTSLSLACTFITIETRLQAI